MTKTTLLSIIVLLTPLFILACNKAPGQYDSLAQCLKAKGAIFYGAYWCPHCQKQKEMFGPSEKYLPYVECSTGGDNAQTLLCQEKKIESYPTWDFADGERVTGSQSLEFLAEKTGCTLPDNIKL